MRLLLVLGHLLAPVAAMTGGVESLAGNTSITAKGIESRQAGPSNNPSHDNFLRRAGGVVAVLGNRIYYDGGTVSERGDPGGKPYNPLNATLSIDLSVSWAADTAPIIEITKPNSPTMEVQAILTDQNSSCFYSWGGYSAYNLIVPQPPQLWMFCNPGGSDLGSWKQVQVPPNAVRNFTQLTNVAFSAFASTGDAGFVFGGRGYKISPVTAAENSNQYLSFNFATLAWSWYQLPGRLSKDQTLWGSEAIYVPNFGTNGLIFILGGLAGRGAPEPTYLDFRTIHFMDPGTHEWFEQATTAPGENFPDPAHQHCIAGVSGADNKTYEIYMFGGAYDVTGDSYSSVYVLSLPSFTWVLAEKGRSEYAREHHSCTIVGKSQFLSWGGVRSVKNGETGYSLKDPFPQGLGIFDLNTLQWTGEFKADADPYRAHDEIVAARATATEYSDEVRGFFDPRSSRGEFPGPTGQGARALSSTPVGAIVGGVVGGAALIAIAVAIWFFVSRRRRRARSPQGTQSAAVPDVKTQYEPVHGAASPKPAAELPEQDRLAEMMGHRDEPSRPVHEMDGGHGHSRR